MSSEHQSDIHLRVAIEGDLDRLVYWDEEAAIASTGSGFSDHARMRTRSVYAEAMQDSKKEVMIAVSDGKDVGSVFFEHDRKVEDVTEVIGEPFCELAAGVLPTADDLLLVFRNEVPGLKRSYLKSLAIDAVLRGKGVGRRFMDAILDYLRDKRVDVVTFSTGRDNAAMRGLMKEAVFLEVRSSHGGYADTKLLGLVDLRKKK
jgi:ribosomal protein S18 acetylase RimI-like enzyme